ncbi:hypothetical protein BX600DRAFT_534207 [Xylariales sp. PMI_506]|nr:hypothetical protein BX600DRAFT_534207 [Xylariales sp. PMI_506]
MADDQAGFACPYWKADPTFHNRCSIYALMRIRDVKQHLSRSHQLPIYCPRCFEVFPDERMRDEHVQSSHCSVRLIGRPVGITEAQKRLLSKRAPAHQTSEKQWYDIFEILFPDNQIKPLSPYLTLQGFRDVSKYNKLNGTTEGDEIFTDSGYASLPHEASIPSRGGDGDRMAQGHTEMRRIDNTEVLDETATVYSASTAVDDRLAQESITYICDNICDSMQRDMVVANLESSGVDLSRLLKAFALRLGTNKSNGLNQRIMHFVHKRHGSSSIIAAQLESRFRHHHDNDAGERNSDGQDVMSLTDKMSLWLNESLAGSEQIVDETDVFQGVKDYDEDCDIVPVDLSIFSQTIISSSAYKWLIRTLKQELKYSWGPESSTIMLDEIRYQIMDDLPSGTISTTRTARTFRIIFEVDASKLRERLREEQYLPSEIPVLTGASEHEIQLTSIAGYLEHTWPENGNDLLNMLHRWCREATFPTFKWNHYASVVDNDGYSTSLDGTESVLRLTCSGPAFFVAQRAEQLAWIVTALHPIVEGPVLYRKPFIDKIGDSFYFIKSSVHGTSSPALGRFLQIVTGKTTNHVIWGYPTVRRPPGFEGLEVTKAFILSGKHLQDANYKIGSGYREINQNLELIKTQDGVSLWRLLTPYSGPELSSAQRDFSRSGVERQIIAFPELEVLGRLSAITSTPIFESGVSTGSPNDRYDMQQVQRARGGQSRPKKESSSISTYFDSDLLSISSVSGESVPPSLNPDDPLASIINSTTNRLLDIVQSNLTRGSNNKGRNTESQCHSKQVNRHGETHLTRSIAPRKRRRIDENGSNNHDDDDDDPDDNGPFVKPNPKAMTQPAKLLACPFWKRNPIKYQRCFHMQLVNTGRVKQHMQRKHTPIYCQVCLVIFRDEDVLEAHLLEYACTRNPEAQLDGLSHKQRSAISAKVKDACNEEQKWFKIWDIVFPEHQRPSSPFIDDRLSACCSLFREHWQNHGPDILLQEMRASESHNLTQDVDVDLNEETRNRALRQVFARGLDAILNSWNPPFGSSSEGSSEHRSLVPLRDRQTTNTGPTRSGMTPESSFLDSALDLQTYETNEASSSSAAHIAGETANLSEFDHLWPTHVDFGEMWQNMNMSTVTQNAESQRLETADVTRSTNRTRPENGGLFSSLQNFEGLFGDDDNWSITCAQMGNGK